MNRIQLSGNRWIGEGEYPFIIAEIGNNHNGSMKLAKEMIKVAKDVGVDAVKFQKKDIESAFPKEMLDGVYSGPNSFGKTYREHKEVLEFSEDDLGEIYEYCRELDIFCFSTPFDQISVVCLERLNNPFYKIASFHVTDLGLIEAVCKTGKPIIISTGMSSTEEIDIAMDLIRRYTDKVVLLQCVSSYPVEDDDVNLMAIPFLKKRYDCPVGYSGHERGVVICVASIPLGACVIERHFTLDRTMKGPDHAASVEPTGMSLIVRRAKYIFKALGAEQKIVLDCELKNRAKFRGY
jgi:sialic acid synthase